MESPPMNLTPERGPSVWDAPRSSGVNWPMAALAITSLIAAYAWRSRSEHRALIAGLGFGTLACGLLARGGPERLAAQWNRIRPPIEPDEDDVDRASEDSFPASDPPAFR
jgi:hypothetical protein